MPRPIALLALSFGALLGACGSDEGAGLQEPGPVANVTVTAPTTMIDVGQTLQLSATAEDADGNLLEGKTFEWSSGIESVASISRTGLLLGLGKGSSRISATTEEVTGSIIISVDLGPRPD